LALALSLDDERTDRQACATAALTGETLTEAVREIASTGPKHPWDVRRDPKCRSEIASRRVQRFQLILYSFQGSRDGWNCRDYYPIEAWHDPFPGCIINETMCSARKSR